MSYSFDLRSNELATVRVPNPGAGRTHRFRAWRLEGDPVDTVSMAGGDVQIAVDEDTDEA